jgi:hypothetical protein
LDKQASYVLDSEGYRDELEQARSTEEQEVQNPDLEVIGGWSVRWDLCPGPPPSQTELADGDKISISNCSQKLELAATC